MIERYLNFLGMDETIQLLEANERPLTPTIRVNTLKIGVGELKKRLEDKGFILEPLEWIPYGFKILNEPLNLGSLHEYLQGYFYIQNTASMLPPIILEPKPNETVIDMCAAPGGKATHLAQIMNNKGTIILIDMNIKRLPALEMNIRRMGIVNSIIMNYNSIQLEKLKIKADKILLDAPCTGEGLIRQDKTRKTSKSIQDLRKMAVIQQKLLLSGLNALKPGGRLLYCTCSIAPEENELTIDYIMRNNPQYQILKISEKYGINGFTKMYGSKLIEDLKHSQRLFPHIHDTIGFYFCLMTNSK